MKKFIIMLPLLLPQLLFCVDDDGEFEKVGTQLNVPGTVDLETRSPRKRWDDKGYDDYLQKPVVQSVEAQGTVNDSSTDEDQYTNNLYSDQYDDQDVDDSLYDRDDSVIR